MEADHELFKRYHNDFQLLNGKLLEYYGHKDELKKCLSHIPTEHDLEEVSFMEVMGSYILSLVIWNMIKTSF